MVENTDIKEGDIVKLKSGGLDMTVSELYAGKKSCHCVWFLNGELKEADFTLASLRKLPSQTR